MVVDLAVLQIFNMVAHTDKDDEEESVAELAEGRTIKIRCSGKGTKLHSDPATELLVAGNEIPKNGKYVIESTSEEIAVHIPSFSRDHTGKYECRARRSDNTIEKTFLTLRLKPRDPTPLGNGLTECSDPQFKKNYCHNKGTCAVSSATGVYMCRCQHGFSGAQCENTDVFVGSSKEDLRLAIGTLATLLGISMFCIMFMIMVMLYQCRKRKTEPEAPWDEPVTPAPISVYTCVKCKVVMNTKGQHVYSSVPSCPDDLPLNGFLIKNGKSPYHWHPSGSWPTALPTGQGGFISLRDSQDNELDRVRRQQFRRSRKLGVSEPDLESPVHYKGDDERSSLLDTIDKLQPSVPATTDDTA